MIRSLICASLLVLAVSGAAAAQGAPETVRGTRIEVEATGGVTRTPDTARISATVASLAPNPTEAIRLNAEKMVRIRSALRTVGLAERDIRTSDIRLRPDYVYQNGLPTTLRGYSAHNGLILRFRDIRAVGRVLEALVREGITGIDGPELEVDRPEQGLDEARVEALAVARQRADVYARTLGLTVARVLDVTERASNVYDYESDSGASISSNSQGRLAVEPGEQNLSVTLRVAFELR